MIINLNKNDKINFDGNVALVFYIPDRCAGCKRVINTLEAKKLENWTVYKIDSDSGEFADLVEQYEVQTAPTVIILENGEQKDFIEGLKTFLSKKDIFGE